MLYTIQSLLDFSTKLAVFVYKFSNCFLVTVTLQYKNVVREIRNCLLHLVKVDTKEASFWITESTSLCE